MARKRNAVAQTPFPCCGCSDCSHGRICDNELKWRIYSGGIKQARDWRNRLLSSTLRKSRTAAATLRIIYEVFPSLRTVHTTEALC